MCLDGSVGRKELCSLRRASAISPLTELVVLDLSLLRMIYILRYIYTRLPLEHIAIFNPCVYIHVHSISYIHTIHYFI